MKIIEALKRDKRGFTLVELIVVLVILVVLAAILVPTLMGYINQAGGLHQPGGRPEGLRGRPVAARSRSG